MSVALLALTAAAGLLIPPTRHFAWAGTACMALLAAAVGLAVMSGLLLLFGDWETPVYTLALATGVLFPAAWLGRTPDGTEDAVDQNDDADDEGGGGGGPPPPDPGPLPRPSSPTLDWDAFDAEREAWTPAPAPRELTPA